MKTCARTGDKHVALFGTTRFLMYAKLKKEGLEIYYIISPNPACFPAGPESQPDPYDYCCS
jgi:hypothetical protein